MQNTPEKEIDLMNLLFAIWRRIWVVIGCAVLAGGAAFLITHYLITPIYRADVSIYVDNKTISEEDNNYISSSSLSAAQRLVKTYVTIIESDTVLEKVVKESGLPMTASQIRKMMSAGSVNDTEVFRIYISNADPELAAKVANAIADVAPDQISNFLSGSSTKVIDYAKVPIKPYTPNYQRNIVLGALIGAVVAMAFICLAAILDVRIDDEEELERMFDHPVLGSIPAFDTTPRTGGKYAYGYSNKKKDKEAKA